MKAEFRNCGDWWWLRYIMQVEVNDLAMHTMVEETAAWFDRQVGKTFNFL